MQVSEVDGVIHRASVLNEPRLLIEIETDRAGGWTLCEQGINGPYPKGGKKELHRQQLVIYERQWAEVQKLVRTDEHERMMADALASAPQAVRPKDSMSLGELKRRAEAKLASASTGPAASVAASVLADIERDIAKEAIRLFCLRPGMADGPPPLTSAKVIKTAAPPPTPQNLAANATSDLTAAFMGAFQQLMETKKRGG